VTKRSFDYTQFADQRRSGLSQPNFSVVDFEGGASDSSTTLALTATALSVLTTYIGDIARLVRFSAYLMGELIHGEEFLIQCCKESQMASSGA
jgi:hypothetical protein